LAKPEVPTGFLKKQWPWWTAGLFTGLAEAINYWLIPFGHPKHKFIGVTTGMSRMLAGLESLLTGTSLIATKPDYQPDIQWVILGALLSGLIFAWLEGEFRDWVYYPKKFLAFVALGAFFFAWGTRVAGGCTLHHLLGGWAAMNVKSYVVMLTATIGALVGLWILAKLNLSQYFKSQDTKWYVKFAKEKDWVDGITLRDDYNPAKDWIRLALYAFWVVFAIVILYMAFFGNPYATKVFGIPFEKTLIYKNMLTAKNLPNIILMLIVGGLLGLSVAKTGFGTECAIIDFEMGQLMADKDTELEYGKKWKMGYSIRTVFKSMGPFSALATHILVASTAFFIGFAVFGIMEGHHWATKELAEAFAASTGLEFHHTGVSMKTIRVQTTLPMDIFGGFLLGIGTVFMLGCEFRNYGRTGLLYITGLLIWPFFYLGYLPYTLARGFWDPLMACCPYAPTTFLPALITLDRTGEIIVWLLYLLFWAALLVWSVKLGAKNLGVSVKDILTKGSEELYIQRLELLEKEDPEYVERMDALEKELAELAEK